MKFAGACWRTWPVDEQFVPHMLAHISAGRPDVQLSVQMSVAEALGTLTVRAVAKLKMMSTRLMIVANVILLLVFRSFGSLVVFGS